MKDAEELLREYKAKFEACLVLVDFGCEEKKRDTSFAMIIELVQKSDYMPDVEQSILKRLAYHAVLDNTVIDNLTDEPTMYSASARYDFYPSILGYLASISYFNKGIIVSLLNSTNRTLEQFGRGSPMQDSAYNIPLHAYNSIVLKKCLKLMERDN